MGQDKAGESGSYPLSDDDRLSYNLDMLAADYHARIADILEGLLFRLGRYELSTEEWNGLLSAISNERMASRRTRLFAILKANIGNI